MDILDKLYEDVTQIKMDLNSELTEAANILTKAIGVYNDQAEAAIQKFNLSRTVVNDEFEKAYARKRAIFMGEDTVDDFMKKVRIDPDEEAKLRVVALEAVEKACEEVISSS